MFSNKGREAGENKEKKNTTTILTVLLRLPKSKQAHLLLLCTRSMERGKLLWVQMEKHRWFNQGSKCREDHVVGRERECVNGSKWLKKCDFKNKFTLRQILLCSSQMFSRDDDTLNLSSSFINLENFSITHQLFNRIFSIKSISTKYLNCIRCRLVSNIAS